MNELTYVILKEEHADPLEKLQRIAFPNTPSEALFFADEFRVHAKLFPEGTFVCLDRDKPVGMGAGIFCDFDWENTQHTLHSAMGDGYYKNHDPNGLYYYGTDISVDPTYRRRGIGKRLYDLRKEVTQKYNKKGILAGGVLPGYIKQMDEMGPLEYVTRVCQGELYDPTLTFQLKNGFRVYGILKNYFPHPSSGGFASLIYWRNPDYKPERPSAEPEDVGLYPVEERKIA